MSLKHAGVWEGRFCWIWLKISLVFKYKNGGVRPLLFNYWNDFALSLAETCFLEVGAYVFLKVATVGAWECRFCWICMKMPQIFENKSGGVGPKDFTVWLLKSSCFRLSRNIFSGSGCIRVSGTSHHRSLRESFLLNFSQSIPFL